MYDVSWKTDVSGLMVDSGAPGGPRSDQIYLPNPFKS